MLAHAAFTLILASVLVSSCAPARDATHAPGATDTTAAAPIRTDRDRYVLEARRIGTVDTKVAFIVVTFTAPPDTTVHIMNCNGQVGWGLQRLANGEWVNAWLTTMNACLSAPIVVPAGTSWVDTMGILSRTDVAPGSYGTVRHGIEPGVYRVVLHGALTSFDIDNPPFGAELSVERRVSGPITIEGGP